MRNHQPKRSDVLAPNVKISWHGSLTSFFVSSLCFKVMGGLSFTPSEKLAMEDGNTKTSDESQPGLRGMKVMTQSTSPFILSVGAITAVRFPHPPIERMGFAIFHRYVAVLWKLVQW